MKRKENKRDTVKMVTKVVLGEFGDGISYIVILPPHFLEKLQVVPADGSFQVEYFSNNYSVFSKQNSTVATVTLHLFFAIC